MKGVTTTRWLNDTARTGPMQCGEGAFWLLNCSTTHGNGRAEMSDNVKHSTTECVVTCCWRDWRAAGGRHAGCPSVVHASSLTSSLSFSNWPTDGQMATYGVAGTLDEHFATGVDEASSRRLWRVTDNICRQYFYKTNSCSRQVDCLASLCTTDRQPADDQHSYWFLYFRRRSATV